MWKAFCCVLLVAASLSGQNRDGADRLNPVLMRAMTGAASAEELAETMFALARPLRQISRGDVEKLGSALSGAMSGRELRETQAAPISRLITALLQGGGSNFALARQLRDALTALRIGDQRTDLIVRRFVAVGGPDDSPVEQNRLEK